MISLGSLDEYSDENWCEEISSPDLYFLTVLTWGGWREGRQLQVQESVLKAFQTIVKPLNKLTDSEIERLAAAYPYDWQRTFLESMVRYLRRNSTSLAELVSRFQEAGPRVALAEMELAMGTSRTKIAACFIRDCAKLDVFPIDSRVGEVLEKDELPSDPWAIGDACDRLRLPGRVFARAVYSRADDLLGGKSNH